MSTFLRLDDFRGFSKEPKDFIRRFEGSERSFVGREVFIGYLKEPMGLVISFGDLRGCPKQTTGFVRTQF